MHIKNPVGDSLVAGTAIEESTRERTRSSLIGRRHFATIVEYLIKEDKCIEIQRRDDMRCDAYT